MSTFLTPPQVLTIAGSDSGGSAGIQADLKTFLARGVYGLSVITTVTAQDTRQVYAALPLPPDFIRAQLEALLGDFTVRAAKTGLLGRVEVIELVASYLREHPLPDLVVDPVLVNHQGQPITPAAAVEAYQQQLFPLASLLTPNTDEAALLTGQPIKRQEDLYSAAQALHRFGAGAVIVKGGQLADEGESVIDLFYDGQQFVELRAPRLPVQNPHGVGCTFAAAVTAELAKGLPLLEAVQQAHRYLHAALRGSLQWQLGQGRRPVNHAVWTSENQE